MLANTIAFEDFGATLAEDVLIPKQPTPTIESLTGEVQTLRLYYGGQAGGEITIRRDRIPSVVIDLIPEIVSLMELKPNWDSYGALPSSLRTVGAAIELISALLKDDSPRPMVVPTSHGGIQFQWEIGSRYLEVEVLRPNRVEGYFIDETDPSSEIEDDFSARVGDLRLHVEALTRV